MWRGASKGGISQTAIEVAAPNFGGYFAGLLFPILTLGLVFMLLRSMFDGNIEITYFFGAIVSVIFSVPSGIELVNVTNKVASRDNYPKSHLKFTLAISEVLFAIATMNIIVTVSMIFGF